MILDSTPSQMNSFLTHSVLLSTATHHCDFHVVLLMKLNLQITESKAKNLKKCRATVVLTAAVRNLCHLKAEHLDLRACMCVCVCVYARTCMWGVCTHACEHPTTDLSGNSHFTSTKLCLNTKKWIHAVTMLLGHHQVTQLKTLKGTIYEQHG